MRGLMTPRLLAGVVLVAFSAGAQVPFAAQTDAIPTGTAGDLAIVVDSSASPQPPFIAASDPLQAGQYVFRLDGGLVQVLPYGAMRGVDARTRVNLPGVPSTLVAAAGAVTQNVVFSAPLDGGLVDLTSAPVLVPTAAALALHGLADGGLEVYADDSAGVLRRIRVEDDGAGGVSGSNQGTISLPGVPSGLVVDDRSGLLYAAIPTGGLFQVDLSQGTVVSLVPLDGGQFGGLVAGLTFYPLFDGGGLLLTTVPATDEVTVHELAGSGQATYVTRFRVQRGLDIVRAPQHVDVVPHRLPGFDAGLFVIHDVSGANYKLVGWDALANSTPVPLPIHIPEEFGLAFDAGVDAGPDAGEFADAGMSDGGVSDGGVSDGGTGGGTGGGAGGGTGGAGGAGGGPPARPVEPTGCGCSGVDASFFPALWGLWLFARSRRRRTGDA